MEYANERADDLMRAYDKYIADTKHICMSEVYRNIVNMPARRFWVSDKRANIVVSAILRGEPCLQSMRALKREMYLEIFRRVQALRILKPDLSTFELCAIVVDQPAPKFYLTPGSAKTMVCKARKEWKKRKLRKLRLL